MNIGFMAFDEAEDMDKSFVIYLNKDNEIHHMAYPCSETRLLKEHNQRYCWSYNGHTWRRYARKFGSKEKYRCYPTNKESLPSKVKLYLMLMEL